MTQIFPDPPSPAPPDFGQRNPPDSPRVLMAQTAAEFAEGQGGETIQMNFPVDVFFQVSPFVTVFFHSGVNPVPTAFSTHPWLIANGVTAV